MCKKGRKKLQLQRQLTKAELPQGGQQDKMDQLLKAELGGQPEQDKIMDQQRKAELGGAKKRV